MWTYRFSNVVFQEANQKFQAKISSKILSAVDDLLPQINKMAVARAVRTSSRDFLKNLL